MSRLPDPAFWRGRRVLVTGHTGFKGGWLSLWLHALGARLRGYALPPHPGSSMFEACGLERFVDHRLGDVRDPDAVRSAVLEFDPEIIFHLAAQPLVRAGYSDPVGTIATNVIGTLNLLEAARLAANLRSIIVVTSDKCYAEDATRMPYREDDPMGGNDPYSASKGCAELITAAYASSFLQAAGVAVASVRAGNVIGGGDWAPDRLVPDLVRALISGTPIVLRNPDSVRPWQHVLDSLAGYLLVAEHSLSARGSSFEAWNFGPDPNCGVSVRELANDMLAIWGTGAALVTGADAAAPREASELRLCSDKARVALGWRPNLSLREAIARAAEWYQAAARGEDMARWSLAEIASYGRVNAAAS